MDKVDIIKQPLSEKDVELISKYRRIKKEVVRDIFTYNVVTISQLAYVVNTSPADVNHYRNMDETNPNYKFLHLTSIANFPYGDNVGVIMILVDERCINYIKRKLKI